LGDGWTQGLHPDDRDHAWQRFSDAFDQRVPFEVEYRLRHEDGTYRWIVAQGVPRFDESGRFEGYIGTSMDITARRDAECERAESEQRYKLIVSGAHDGVWDWDTVSGQVYYSPRWNELIGAPANEIADNIERWLERLHPQDVDRVRANLIRYIDRPHAKAYESEFRILHNDGDYRWMSCRGAAMRNPRDGRAVRLAGSMTDITERKKTEDQLRRDALHDRLTGLANRTLLHQRLEDAITRMQADEEYNFAVLFLDFDRFKVINDSLGHEIGDRLLKSIAERLRHNVRVSSQEDNSRLDLPVRLGGDEFVVVLEDIRTAEDAAAVAERLQQSLNEPYQLDGHLVQSTASIGIVMHDGDYEHAEDMLRDADIAMYRAKNAGKARHVVFNREMHTDVVERMNLESDLRQAVEKGEFEVYYQPILSLECGGLSGFEALVRWNHSRRGMVRPDQFIALAEELGLIVPIGQFVLEESVRQLREWQQRYPSADPLTINVNLSKRQLAQPDLVEVVQKVVQASGIDPQTLKLEVTESAIMDHSHEFIPRLQSLREIGVQLCMDDFGTGHSSLSSLHRFPIQVLKIDRSFVTNMDEHLQFTAVTQAIVTLAHTLNMKVVAEGYLFARPLPGNEAEVFIATGGRSGELPLNEAA